MVTKREPAILMEIHPHFDRSRHTILAIEEIDGIVKFIPLDIAEGLKVVKLKRKVFDDTYKPIPNYPNKKAIEVFIHYAKTLGATLETMKLLATVTPVSDAMINTATSKRQVESNVAPQKPQKEPKPKKEVIEKPKKEPKKEPKIKKEKIVNSTTTKSSSGKPSASQMFKDLIMKGELSDDEIFKQVQDEFGLDDNKRGYVKWYRNDLIKKGLTPPKGK